MIKVSVPGKLFILGEYNVTVPGHHAIVMAVNRYLHVAVEAQDTWQIESAHGVSAPVLKAVARVREFLKTRDLEMKPHRIIITSELEIDGKKIGLGSSGAVIVGVIQALLKSHNVEISQEQLFKLSVLSEWDTKRVGSGADIAAMIYGGVIGYARYDHEFLIKHRFGVELVDMTWPLFRVFTQIAYPSFIVGWTGNPYQTPELRMQSENDWTLAEAIVQAAIDQKRVSLDQIAQYQQWLEQFQVLSGKTIMTPSLTALVSIAQKFGGVGKVSGAGGGDCGLLFAIHDVHSCKQALANQGIMNLDIEVSQ